MMNKSFSIYIHVPFCEKKCIYCDFASFVAKEDVKEKYFDSLLDEIKNCKYTGSVKTIYFGGGTPSSASEKYIKNILDFLAALILLLCIWWLLLIIAIVILVTDGMPVFFTQKRIGQYGKEFKIYKFRTMVKNAEAIGPKATADGDNRITPVGRFLRKTSLDEIPQLLNVLKGDMSFIGPRPDLPSSLHEIYRPGDEVKLTVNPGITGYSQAYYRNSSTLDQRFDGDVFYAKNLSFALDVKILFKTVKTVFTHENVFRNN